LHQDSRLTVSISFAVTLVDPKQSLDPPPIARIPKDSAQMGTFGHNTIALMWFSTWVVLEI